MMGRQTADTPCVLCVAIRLPAKSDGSHGSTASLLSNEKAMASHSASGQHNSKFRDFLRHVRLLFPGSFLTCRVFRKYATEQRKIAAYQSRRMAVLISLLHVIPLVGATILLMLYWTKHWIGREPSILTALQFVAKLHEITMQASMVDILVYFIRSQALNGYIPLGALSGAAQASQLSYLWSLDFILDIVGHDHYCGTFVRSAHDSATRHGEHQCHHVALSKYIRRVAVPNISG